MLFKVDVVILLRGIELGAVICQICFPDRSSSDREVVALALSAFNIAKGSKPASCRDADEDAGRESTSIDRCTSFFFLANE